MSTSKQSVINPVLITYIDYSITENYTVSEKWRPFCRTHVRSIFSKFCITFTNISCGTVAISSRMENLSVWCAISKVGIVGP
jgi:hypothetical protein